MLERRECADTLEHPAPLKKYALISIWFVEFPSPFRHPVLLPSSSVRSGPVPPSLVTFVNDRQACRYVKVGVERLADRSRSSDNPRRHPLTTGDDILKTWIVAQCGAHETRDSARTTEVGLRDWRCPDLAEPWLRVVQFHRRLRALRSSDI